jgi:hypothetical protein
MPFNTKPTKPRWADGAPSYAVEPSDGKKNVGWQSQEKPPYQWMNWLFLKIKQWLDWNEDREDFQDSISFHTTGGTIDWSGSAVTCPVDGMYIEWRDGASIINNILPAGAYNLADGQYLVFIPHNTPGTNLSLGVYATLSAGQYAIVAGASLTDKTTVQEIILFRRRGPVVGTAVLEVPLFKTAVQSGGSLAANDLLVHKHSDPDDGGQLDWDICWADAVHSHSSNAEGGSALGPVTALTAANDLDIGSYNFRAETLQSDVATGTAPLAVASQTKVDNLNADLLDGYNTYDGTVPVADRILITQANGWLYTPNSDPTANYHVANKKYVDDNAYHAHTHEFTGYEPIYPDWDLSFSVSHADWFEEWLAWQGYGDASGHVHFYIYDDGAADCNWAIGWEVFADHVGALHLRADTLPDRHITITDTVNDGGGWYHFVTDGGDLSAYTSILHARWHCHLMGFRSTNTKDGWTQLYVLAGSVDGPSEEIVIYTDGYAQDDIVIPFIAGLNHFNADFDGDNGYEVHCVNTISGDNWRLSVKIRIGSGDGWAVAIGVTVLPKTTSSS